MSETRPAPLAGLKVIEISAFVAAPLGAMTLAQLGADVIRIDPIGGNIDANRWPISDDGTSIYWASLNKGKRSVTLDLKSEEGQKIATDLIAEAGTLVTNLPARGWLSYDNLVQHREDLVMLRLNGSHDGKPAVDYTINAASGFPIITGDDERPVNNAHPGLGRHRWALHLQWDHCRRAGTTLVGQGAGDHPGTVRRHARDRGQPRLHRRGAVDR